MQPGSIALIPEVPYPKRYLAELRRLGPLMIRSMESEGLPIQSGQINLGKLDPKLDLAYFFFLWVSEANKVIGHLNLTLSDLHALPRTISTLGGSPWMRYELLIRTFFHEFYRLRELLNAVLGQVAKRGIITKEELAKARSAFHGAIEGTVELRNSLVHGSVLWRGKEHFELNLISMLHNRGQRIVSRRKGDELAIEKVLAKACNKTARVMRAEGVKGSKLMSAFVRDTVAAMREA